MRQRAQEALVEMNAMLQQLSPAPLEKVGLVQALHDQCEALGYRTGAEVVPEIGNLPDDDRLPIGAQETIFRIAQEALSNIARHARASHVYLRLHQYSDQETLILEVEDDGQGFDINTATNGMGLTNMRQRAASLDGALKITTVPNEGTKLSIKILLVKPTPIEEEVVYPRDYTIARILYAGLVTGYVFHSNNPFEMYILRPKGSVI